MMGPDKLSTMRVEVRRAFKRSDADLLAWFNAQMGALQKKPKSNGTELETLRLLRDALLQKPKRPAPRRRRPRAGGRSKSA